MPITVLPVTFCNFVLCNTRTRTDVDLSYCAAHACVLSDPFAIAPQVQGKTNSTLQKFFLKKSFNITLKDERFNVFCKFKRRNSDGIFMIKFYLWTFKRQNVSAGKTTCLFQVKKVRVPYQPKRCDVF